MNKRLVKLLTVSVNAVALDHAVERTPIDFETVMVDPPATAGGTDRIQV
jgi:hypothetical protein